MSKPVLLVVSAALAPTPTTTPGPRKDYAVLAEALQATMLDRSAVDRSRTTRLLARLLGTGVAEAWLAFRRRDDVAAIVTDGEHIGIPLALLLKLARARVPHITIGHRITASKKRPFWRWLGVHSHIARVVLHARYQYECAVSELGIPDDHLALVPYQVDTAFWQPQPVTEERLVCSAGLEFRDYPTLMQAADGLDARVVIAAASHWSKRRNTAAAAERPANVEVRAFDYLALRDLYARAAVVVVPLDDIDFQAGVTTILEAMAMAKPVVVTHSRGQTDVVEDRREVTRGDSPRPRSTSLLRSLAVEGGVEVEQTGFYVPPGDPAALRRAVAYLLDHPEERRRLGTAGRRLVESLMTVEQFAARLGALVDDAIRAAEADRPLAPTGGGAARVPRGDARAATST